MSEKRFFNIATSRADTNNPDKKYWTQHGILIWSTNDQGEERIAIKLNSFPIGADFDGWFSAFPKEEDATGMNARSNSTRPNRYQRPAINTDDYDDSIPFHH